jgi:hypothetical protein
MAEAMDPVEPRYQRMVGCGVPGCGKPASAEIHDPADE